MNEQDEALIKEADMSDAERERFRQREWLLLCRLLFCGPDKIEQPVQTPEGGRDDLYDVIRKAQAILS